MYYRWKKAEERRNQRIREEREDILAVKEVFEENHRTYGCRRMKRAMEKNDYHDPSTFGCGIFAEGTWETAGLRNPKQNHEP